MHTIIFTSFPWFCGNFISNTCVFHGIVSSLGKDETPSDQDQNSREDVAGTQSLTWSFEANPQDISLMYNYTIKNHLGDDRE